MDKKQKAFLESIRELVSQYIETGSRSDHFVLLTHMQVYFVIYDKDEDSTIQSHLAIKATVDAEDLN